MNLRSPVDPPLALRFRSIAFDFDGTLADTSPAIVDTAEQTLKELGLPALERAHFRALIGIPLGDAFAAAGVPAELVATAVSKYREIFPRFKASVGLYPGVRECLENLRVREVRLGVVSSRSRASLLDLIDELAIGAYFEAILGEEDAVRPKPAPDLVLRLSERFVVSPAEILVVGDTTFDIEMGRSAGSITVAVTYGNQERLQLAGSSPNYFADSLDELWTVLS